MMAALLRRLDLADALAVAGAACIAVTVYWLAPLFLPLYAGVVLIVAAFLFALRPTRKDTGNGTAR